MSKNKGRQTENLLQQQAMGSQAAANTAITKAEAPDPLEARRRAYVERILDFSEGKGGPPDVRNFPDQTAMSLYTDAKRVTDAGRVGKGYGTLSDGGNATYAAALGQELEHERGLEASGRLDDFMNSSILGARAEAGDLASVGNARSMKLAQLRNSNYNSDQDRWLAYLSRPQQPSFLKSLALGAVSGLAGNAGLAKMI